MLLGGKVVVCVFLQLVCVVFCQQLLSSCSDTTGAAADISLNGSYGDGGYDDYHYGGDDDDDYHYDDDGGGNDEWFMVMKVLSFLVYVICCYLQYKED